MTSKLLRTLSNSRPSSPLYLHIDKETPVHLYVDKDNMNDISRKQQRPRKPGINVPTSKLMKKSKLNRTRSVSPPWIPPPGKSTKGMKNAIDPFWNENEVQLTQQELYEGQINDLLDEVKDLKNQLELERQKEDTYSEKDEYKQDMDLLGKPEKVKSEEVIKSLVESEDSANLCGSQIQQLMDNIQDVLQRGQRISTRDLEHIIRLLDDVGLPLYDFQSKADHLRSLLSQFHEQTLKDEQKYQEQSNDLENVSAKLNDLQQELKDREHLLEDANIKLSKLEAESIGYNTTHESLEQIRGHLQQQLRQKSGDCNRMAVQIRTLENELAKERLDKENLIELLKSPGGPQSLDRETIKKAAKAQKYRAKRAEETVQKLSALLTEKERQIEQLMIDSHEDEMKMKRMETFEEENEMLRHQLQRDNSNTVQSLQKENENLRSVADECESRLHQVEQEMNTLRENIGEDSDDQRNEVQINKLTKFMEKLEESEKLNNSHQSKIDELERKNRNLENQITDMKKELKDNEGKSVDNKCQVEELIKENSSLMRQLEAALVDTKRSSDNNKDKGTGKERSMQSRTHELESTLNQQRAEVAKWRRACEDTERKCETRLQDIQIQLEQAERTNHSLQTYIQFLKKSYTNVFGNMSAYPSSFVGSTGVSNGVSNTGITGLTL